MSLEKRLRAILVGIDQDERDGGYWPTSKGVKFGALVLSKVSAEANLFDQNHMLSLNKIKTLKKEIAEITPNCDQSHKMR